MSLPGMAQDDDIINSGTLDAETRQKLRDAVKEFRDNPPEIGQTGRNVERVDREFQKRVEDFAKEGDTEGLERLERDYREAREEALAKDKEEAAEEQALKDRFRNTDRNTVNKKRTLSKRPSPPSRTVPVRPAKTQRQRALENYQNVTRQQRQRYEQRQRRY